MTTHLTSVGVIGLAVMGSNVARSLATQGHSISAGLAERQRVWHRVAGLATSTGVPVPGFSSALAHHDTVQADRFGTFHTLCSQGGAEVQVSTP